MLWPPSYTLKKHARARHVKLKASLHYGLEVVIPTRFNIKNIPQILEDNKQWIQKKLADFGEKSQEESLQNLPSQIILAAINQTWSIVYCPTDNKNLRLFTRQEEIVILGDIHDQKKSKKLLVAWIKKQAKIYLPNHLEKLSQQTCLSYKKMTVRNQKTCWGSCSKNQSISLNYKLLFLPQSLANHVMIHELCHTLHLNHSPAFWEAVASFDPQWQTHKQALRHADKWVPRWII